ncbi:MAG TPA: M20/M25/M40 family metallo-hydrolase [Steroidobacteraceae bacterium]|jgi:acetylornithine deacetylase/succinyl-diaminopimelate desuccinylase-like protein|nr:M20/M25/M40 family metallo-hydrolase [Steroidobacteraceae bacterium]
MLRTPALAAVLVLLPALAATAANAPPARRADPADGVQAYRLSHERAILQQLDTLGRLRSVAADPAGLAAAAHTLLGWLTQRGFQAQLIQTGAQAPPLVYGEWSRPGPRRTVIFYAHYDGQPVVPAQWHSDPFVPQMRSAALSAGGREVDWQTATPPFNPEWRLFGRAVADDKASIIALLAAFDALRSLGREPQVNLKVLWEGEEEAGSAHLQAALLANSSLLRSDLLVIGDGPVHQSRRPMLYFGARGMLGLTLTIYGPLTPLHDGHYGNWAPNPAIMATALLASMRDQQGRILIPGFSDQVRALTPTERQALAAVPVVDPILRRQFALGRTEAADGLAASLMRPALNVRGLQSGQVGPTAANAIPATAGLSLDFRLVPDQTPAQIRAVVERFLRARGWTIVTQEPDVATRLAHARVVRVQWEPGYPAYRVDIGSPIMQAVQTAARRSGAGPLVLMPMMGASVPMFLFAQSLDVPIVGLPIVNYDDSQHAPDENLRLQNLWDGVQTYAAMMGTLNW